MAVSACCVLLLPYLKACNAYICHVLRHVLIIATLLLAGAAVAILSGLSSYAACCSRSSSSHLATNGGLQHILAHVLGSCELAAMLNRWLTRICNVCMCACVQQHTCYACRNAWLVTVHVGLCDVVSKLPWAVWSAPCVFERL